ncbi:type VI secretion system-associated protein TagO [Pseudomonas gingeri NCPPB 3146 = LMG 5327]|uniref:Type VI secretion system-associated protein TagO n=2 Tax=Pseudomonas gingeri TaxID=117681 RepID=A0A7Y7Y4U5_9PSED|nr:type VI secretion system-associated protein VasI [Pseudomonas gingeri]NWC17835.1 type VI secretion system-associated protein TagO [Pseudomonas gingeri]PNQ94121.1 type VI secretion system-associated protein TagO [Pseudomonas gingeri NCPPB 3146 = LMG 5327]
MRWGLCLLWVVAIRASATPVARDCTAIVSSLKRLECFDLVAGTPARPSPVRPQVAVGGTPAIVDLVRHNEARRQPEDGRFLISISSLSESENERHRRVVISAPALGALPPRPLLAISCESQITRLQLVLDEPPEPNKIRIQLFNNERPVSPAYQWRVLDSGLVVDAGRGLPAIALLRQMGGGQRLRLASDYPPLDGLVFDAEGLGELIEQERQVCRW